MSGRCRNNLKQDREGRRGGGANRLGAHAVHHLLCCDSFPWWHTREKILFVLKPMFCVVRVAFILSKDVFSLVLLKRTMGHTVLYWRFSTGFNTVLKILLCTLNRPLHSWHSCRAVILILSYPSFTLYYSFLYYSSGPIMRNSLTRN